MHGFVHGLCELQRFEALVVSLSSCSIHLGFLTRVSTFLSSNLFRVFDFFVVSNLETPLRFCGISLQISSRSRVFAWSAGSLLKVFLFFEFRFEVFRSV